MLGAEGAVMFSDSQGSTIASETHGWQKQCVGKDFLVGCAGHGLIINALMPAVDKAVAAGTVDSTNIETFITTFMTTEVAANVRAQIQVLVALPTELKWYVPEVLVRFLRCSEYLASIGSGSEFVNRAFMRNLRQGIFHGTETLADTFVAIEDFSDAANESLTVDDRFTVGVLSNGKTYLMGHGDINVNLVPPQIAARWRSDVAPRFDEILGIARAIRGEIREARRQLASLRVGAFDVPHIQQLLVHNGAIGATRQVLQQKVAEYLQWYDVELGRVPPPPPALPAAGAAPPPPTP
jgi:hypothetical protein